MCICFNVCCILSSGICDFSICVWEWQTKAEFGQISESIWLSDIFSLGFRHKQALLIFKRQASSLLICWSPALCFRDGGSFRRQHYLKSRWANGAFCGHYSPGRAWTSQRTGQNLVREAGVCQRLYMDGEAMDEYVCGNKWGLF